MRCRRIPGAGVRPLALALLVGSLAVPAAAQGAPSSQPRGRWTLVAPDAALAWFAVLADHRLPGAGAFPFVAAGTAARTDPALVRALAESREGEVLHFVPLYHPSADRAALAAALEAAAEGRPAPTPRATLLVGALGEAMRPATRREQLPPLARALRAATPAGLDPEAAARWQRALDSLYLPALAPWLAAERLDAGRLIVAPAIGAEGRLFAATQDRGDNLAAVGAFTGDPDPEAPLLAFTREACFPAVSRAARSARLDARDPASSRRASLAAVRCGATLLERRLPQRADAYRAFWLRRAAEAGVAAGPVPAEPGARRAAFDRAFPPDPALTQPVEAALARVAPRR